MGLQDLTPQLRTRLGRVEWFVGMFLAVTGLLMVAAFVSYLKRTAEERGWFVTEAPYYTFLPDASGVKVGTPVNMMGFKVGEVTQVTAIDLWDRLSWDHYVTNQFNVFVAFKVRAPFPGYINSDARLKLGGLPVDLLGGTVLELTQGTTNGVVTFDKAPNGQPGVLSDKFAISDPGPDRTNKHMRYDPVKNTKGYYLQMEQDETLMVQAERLMSRLDHMAGTVDEALPPMLEELQASLETLRRALPGMTNQVGDLLETARLTLPGLTNNLDAVLLNTRDLTAQLRDTWPMLTNTLDTTLDTTRQLASNINVAIPNLTSNVNVTLGSLNVLLGRDTNITANSSLLVSNINQVLTRHWLFRSVFKGEEEEKKDSVRRPFRRTTPIRPPRGW